MIARIDRMQVAVRSRRSAAETWRRLFDAGMVGEDRVPSLGATRTVLRLGESELELLEPDGLGAVAQHLSRAPTAVFAVGLAVRDLALCRESLDARGIHHQVEGAQVWLLGEWLGIPGMRIVLTQDEEHEPAGLAARIYEATHLMDGYARAADRLAKVFDLDTANFVPIESEEYGYRGVLTRFRPERLDRIETVTPIDRSKAMGRFFRSPRAVPVHVLYRVRSDPRPPHTPRGTHPGGMGGRPGGFGSRQPVCPAPGIARRATRREPRKRRVALERSSGSRPRSVSGVPPAHPEEGR